MAAEFGKDAFWNLEQSLCQIGMQLIDDGPSERPGRARNKCKHSNFLQSIGCKRHTGTTVVRSVLHFLIQRFTGTSTAGTLRLFKTSG
jgi:hypothetical protein